MVAKEEEGPPQRVQEPVAGLCDVGYTLRTNLARPSPYVRVDGVSTVLS